MDGDLETAPKAAPLVTESAKGAANNAKPAKKRRAKKCTLQESHRPPCHLTRIPLEILAEILSYTTSPRDILSLSRCSKYFCATLVNNPSSTFIWKHARARCIPAPIPDPTPNFTEASYAAFIFDHGICEVCTKRTSCMYTSFAIRLRLCSRKDCRNKWRDSHGYVAKNVPDRYKPLLRWIPRAEKSADFNYRFPVHDQFLGPLIRRTDWEKAVDDLNKSILEDVTVPTYIDNTDRLAKKLPVIMEFTSNLRRWKDDRDTQAQTILQQNATKTKCIALNEGWKESDLTMTNSFSSLRRARDTNLEDITDRDVEMIRTQLETELLRLVEKRQRRETEKSYFQRRRDVQEHYEKLKSEDKQEVMPNLPQFRKLPIVNLLQKKPTRDSGVKIELNQPTMKGLLKVDLTHWRDNAKESFASMLGLPGWKSASTNKLHPTERLTARFKCKKCDSSKLAQKSFDYGSLSFAEACEHQCQHLDKRQRTKEVWIAENFEPDQQAIDAVKQVLIQFNVNSEDISSLKTLENLGARILCSTCPAPIVMDFETMIRHCRRHEEPRNEVLSEQRAKELLKHPFEPGLRSKLTPRSATDLRKKRVYGCRHCDGIPPAVLKPSASVGPDVVKSAELEASSDPPITSEKTPSDPKKDKDQAVSGNKGESMRQDLNTVRRQRKKTKELFGFDGLRSHAKEKHGIEWIGDEDFYRQKDTDATVAVADATD